MLHFSSWNVCSLVPRSMVYTTYRDWTTLGNRIYLSTQAFPFHNCFQMGSSLMSVQKPPSPTQQSHFTGHSDCVEGKVNVVTQPQLRINGTSMVSWDCQGQPLSLEFSLHVIFNKKSPTNPSLCSQVGDVSDACKAFFPLSLFLCPQGMMRPGCVFSSAVFILFGDSPTFLCLWPDVFCCFDKFLSIISSNISSDPHPPSCPSPPSAVIYARTFQYCPVAFGFSVLFFALFFTLCALVWSFSLVYLCVQ